MWFPGEDTQNCGLVNLSSRSETHNVWQTPALLPAVAVCEGLREAGLG